MKPIDFWTLVDYLPTRMPFSKEAIEKILGVVLLKKENANEVFDFFEGGPAHLSDNTEIEHIDLRVSRKSPTKRLLVLSLTGGCIERSVVMSRYKDMTLLDYPRGRSTQEKFSWSAKQPWGSLRFGFLADKMDCLQSVVFASD